ncbi:hypothetical protein FS837_008931 [Tulasnella sp. UAMH 9824]|nr:hypothetical protein FS837_008931 [Tulasnella sp. UAMH 9824]
MNPATPAAVDSAVNILLQSIFNENRNTLEAESKTRSSSYRKDTKTHASSLAHVDDHVEAIKLTLDSVQRQLLQKISTLRTEHNRMIPLHQLPIEIFIRIISDALAPLRTLGRSRSTCLSRLVRFSPVCKRWKDVIEGTPSFWTIIDILDPPAIISAAISRSESRPLNIIAISSGMMQLVSHFHTFCHPDKLNQFITTAITVSPRWRSIQLVVPSSEKASAVMNAPAPIMKSLDLESRRPIRVGFSNGGVAFQGTDPQLRRVRLHCVAIPWDSYLLRGLRDLSISGLETFAPSCEETLAILKACPGLVALNLSLKPAATVESPKKATPLTLAELQSLSFSLNPSFALTLFETIRLPSIRFVHLHLNFSSDLDHILFPKLIQHAQSLFSVVFRKNYSLFITVYSGDSLHWTCKPDQTSRGGRKFEITTQYKPASETLECLVETLLNRFTPEFVEVYFDCPRRLRLSTFLEVFDGVDCVNTILVSGCDLDPLLTYMSCPTASLQWGFPKLERLTVYACNYNPLNLLSMVEARYGQEVQGSSIPYNQPELPPPLKSITISHADGGANRDILALVEDILGPDCLQYDEDADC